MEKLLFRKVPFLVFFLIFIYYIKMLKVFNRTLKKFVNILTPSKRNVYARKKRKTHKKKNMRKKSMRKGKK
jgi:hypothetical protein|tara:strand:- start:210 stop:422 length:213 start_codon:yes stop_codon:yes gene_type:complete